MEQILLSQIDTYIAMNFSGAREFSFWSSPKKIKKRTKNPERRIAPGGITASLGSHCLLALLDP